VELDLSAVGEEEEHGVEFRISRWARNDNRPGVYLKCR
jgi:hypothetical protein